MLPPASHTNISMVVDLGGGVGICLGCFADYGYAASLVNANTLSPFQPGAEACSVWGEYLNRGRR